MSDYSDTPKPPEPVEIKKIETERKEDVEKRYEKQSQVEVKEQEQLKEQRLSDIEAKLEREKELQEAVEKTEEKRLMFENMCAVLEKAMEEKKDFESLIVLKKDNEFGRQAFIAEQRIPGPEIKAPDTPKISAHEAIVGIICAYGIQVCRESYDAVRKSELLQQMMTRLNDQRGIRF